MKFSLIICTYMRPHTISKLLGSVVNQTCYPDEILVVDGSKNNDTSDLLSASDLKNLRYFLVSDQTRGLTKQRNFGVSKVSPDSEIVCFLDDDTVLEPKYFENILKVFREYPDAVGVGGLAINEGRWQPNTQGIESSATHKVIDGFVIAESSRTALRNRLGLGPGAMPGIMPEHSHGSTLSYPPTGKIYPVDLLIGLSMNFRKSVFDHIRFSTYFEGYGLYEDADFSVRAQKYGNNYVASGAHLHHFHDYAGRPNKYDYGKMVVRNGWYVWRVKYPHPSVKARLKWHAITWLLAIVRLSNAVIGPKRKEAFTESMGRISGWFSLIFNKPKQS